MEYKERIPVKHYRPLFGYGYDPEAKRKAKKENTAEKDRAETMPVPAEPPLAALIAVVILLLAFLIGAIIATRLEARDVTINDRVPRMTEALCLAGGDVPEYSGLQII